MTQVRNDGRWGGGVSVRRFGHSGRAPMVVNSEKCRILSNLGLVDCGRLALRAPPRRGALRRRRADAELRLFKFQNSWCATFLGARISGQERPCRSNLSRGAERQSGENAVEPLIEMV